MYENLIYECQTKIRMSHSDIDDPLIRQAVKTYVAMNFGQPDNYEQLLSSYNSQKGSLQTYSDYK